MAGSTTTLHPALPKHCLDFTLKEMEKSFASGKRENSAGAVYAGACATGSIVDGSIVDGWVTGHPTAYGNWTQFKMSGAPVGPAVEVPLPLLATEMITMNAKIAAKTHGHFLFFFDGAGGAGYWVAGC
jgi:hypothetical protein